MKLPKFNMDGQQTGEVDLNDSVFNVAVNKGLIYDLIRAEQMNRRQGNASTKGRSFVSGGGAKPWRQKGTGRARQGSIRATQWVGGGVPHGAKPRPFEIRMPQKMRQSAYRSILSYKANMGAVKVLDQFVLAEAKTRLAAAVLKKLEINYKITIVLDDDSSSLKLALRNIPNVKYIHFSRLSGQDLFLNKEILVTEKAAKELEKALMLA